MGMGDKEVPDYCMFLPESERKLGRKPRTERTCSERNAVSRAITINICPDKRINRKRWYDYDYDKQREILLRMENASRNTTPVVCESLNFEECPDLCQIHFHALYFHVTDEDMATIRKFWDDRVKCGQWRHLDDQEIYDSKGWLRYIQKGINNNNYPDIISP